MEPTGAVLPGGEFQAAPYGPESDTEGGEAGCHMAQQIEELRQTNDYLEAKNSENRQQLAKMKAEHGASDCAAQEAVQRLEEQLRQCEAQLQQLSAQRDQVVAQAEQLSAQRDQAHAQVQQLQMAATAAQGHTQAAEQALQNAKAAAEFQASSLIDELQALEDEVVTLKQQLAEMAAQAGDAGSAAVRLQLEEVQQQLADKVQATDAMRQQLEEVQWQLAEQKQAATGELEELQARVTELEALEAAAAEAQQAFKRMRCEAAGLARRLAEAERDNKALSAECLATRGELAAAQQVQQAQQEMQEKMAGARALLSFDVPASIAVPITDCTAGARGTTSSRSAVSAELPSGISAGDTAGGPHSAAQRAADAAAAAAAAGSCGRGQPQRHTSPRVEASWPAATLAAPSGGSAGRVGITGTTPAVDPVTVGTASDTARTGQLAADAACGSPPSRQLRSTIAKDKAPSAAGALCGAASGAADVASGSQSKLTAAPGASSRGAAMPSSAPGATTGGQQQQRAPQQLLQQLQQARGAAAAPAGKAPMPEAIKCKNSETELLRLLCLPTTLDLKAGLDKEDKDVRPVPAVVASLKLAYVAALSVFVEKGGAVPWALNSKLVGYVLMPGLEGGGGACLALGFSMLQSERGGKSPQLFPLTDGLQRLFQLPAPAGTAASGPAVSASVQEAYAATLLSWRAGILKAAGGYNSLSALDELVPLVGHGGASLFKQKRWHEVACALNQLQMRVALGPPGALPPAGKFEAGACCSAPATAGDYPPYGHTQKPAYNSYPPGVPPVDGYKPAAASSYQHPSAGGSTVQGIPAAGASQAYMPHAHSAPPVMYGAHPPPPAGYPSMGPAPSYPGSYQYPPAQMHYGAPPPAPYMQQQQPYMQQQQQQPYYGGRPGRYGRPGMGAGSGMFLGAGAGLLGGLLIADAMTPDCGGGMDCGGGDGGGGGGE